MILMLAVSLPTNFFFLKSQLERWKRLIYFTYSSDFILNVHLILGIFFSFPFLRGRKAWLASGWTFFETADQFDAPCQALLV